MEIKMNERIKELMGKTLDDKFSHTWTTMTYEDLEKFSEQFAELIVAECGDVAYNAYWENPETVRGIHLKEKIKEHFGVKL